MNEEIMSVQYKYVKTRVGAQHAYKVYHEGEFIGQVIQDWAKLWGGACWSIKSEGDQKVIFDTRRSASHYLKGEIK